MKKSKTDTEGVCGDNTLYLAHVIFYHLYNFAATTTWPAKMTLLWEPVNTYTCSILATIEPGGAREYHSHLVVSLPPGPNNLPYILSPLSHICILSISSSS